MITGLSEAFYLVLPISHRLRAVRLRLFAPHEGRKKRAAAGLEERTFVSTNENQEEGIGPIVSGSEILEGAAMRNDH